VERRIPGEKGQRTFAIQILPTYAQCIGRYGERVKHSRLAHMERLAAVP
jgi:hypothetical protein